MSIDVETFSIVGGVLCFVLAVIVIFCVSLLIHLLVKMKRTAREAVVQELLYRGVSTELYIGQVGRKPKMLKAFNSFELMKQEADLLEGVTENACMFLQFKDTCECLIDSQVVWCLIGSVNNSPKYTLRMLLKTKVLSFDQMTQLAISLIEGLSYLHHRLGVVNQAINSNSCMISNTGEKCIIVDLEHTTATDEATSPSDMVKHLCR